MFGMGPLELVIILIVGMLSFGLPIAIVVIALLLWKHNNAERDSELLARLRDENQRLRDELAAATRKNA